MALSSGKIKIVYLPDTVVKLKSYSLSNKNLEKVVLSASLTSIDEGTFSGCSALKEITLPDTLVSIGNSAFVDCRSLKTLEIPSSVKYMGMEAFAGSGLETVILNEGLEHIGFNAFMLCPITEITVPSSVKIIYAGAFSHCSSLTKVVLNEGLESIGYRTFEGSKITEISIPSTVVTMDERAFQGCDSVKKVYFQGNAPQKYSTEETQRYMGNEDYTVYYLEGAEGFTSPEWCGHKCQQVGESSSIEQPSIKQLGTYFPEEFFEYSRLNTGDAVFDIDVTTAGFDEEPTEIAGYVNFVDPLTYYKNWKVAINVSENIKCFAFIEIDEGIAYRVGKVLYVHNTEDGDEPLMLHTYINDFTRNRGLCYITGDGEVVYYSFGCNMNTGEVGYGRDVYNLGNIPKGTYCPKLTGTEYKWQGNDIFEEYFNNYVLDQYRTEWTHIGVTEGVYTDFTYKGYTKFDVYRVEYYNTEEYYAVPYGETQIEAVYKFQFDDTMIPVWIKPQT